MSGGVGENPLNPESVPGDRRRQREGDFELPMEGAGPNLSCRALSGTIPSPQIPFAPPDCSDLMTIPQAAKYLSWSPRTINNLIERRTLRRRKLGWYVRLGRNAIDRAMDRFRVKSVVCARRVFAVRDNGPRRWLTKQEVAAQLDCSRRTVGQLMSRRLLAFTEIGRLVRIDLLDIYATIDAFSARAMSSAPEVEKAESEHARHGSRNLGRRQF